MELALRLRADGGFVAYNLADPSGFTDIEWRQFSALLKLGPDQITTDEAVATETAWAARQLAGTDHV